MAVDGNNSKINYAVEFTPIVKQHPLNLADCRKPITTVVEYTAAGTLLKFAKAAWTALEDKRKYYVDPLNATVKRINEDARAQQAPYAQAETLLKNQMVAFDNEQRRIAQEAQRKAREDAQREQDRLNAKAREEARIAAEKAEDLRRQAAAAEAEGRAKEAAKLAAKADSVEVKGAQKAGELETRAATSVAPLIVPQMAKVGGVRSSLVWTYEVTNPDIVPDAFWKIDEEKIGKLVKSMGEGAQSLLGNGVRVYQTSQIGAARR